MRVGIPHHGGAFWLKSELFLTKIRTTNSEIHSFGRAKKKGVGGKELFSVLPMKIFIPESLYPKYEGLVP